MLLTYSLYTYTDCINRNAMFGLKLFKDVSIHGIIYPKVELGMSKCYYYSLTTYLYLTELQNH